MRRHDNIGYDAFNTFRSGDENSRRYDYGNPVSNPRGGRSVYARSSRDTDASDHNYSTDPGYYGSGYSNRNQPQQPGRGSYESNRYSQIRPQNQSNQYSNRGAYNPPANNYRNENRSWQDRAETRRENWTDRAEERRERWDNKINDAWDNWGGDANNRVRQNWMNEPENYPTYSHGNAYSNRYSDNYDNPAYGNRYDNRSDFRGDNRGDNRNDYRSDYRRNRDEDEGFFGNIGNRISNVWDRWTGDESDEDRRYQQRNPPSSDRPPYNDRPSSRRDY